MHTSIPSGYDGLVATINSHQFRMLIDGKLVEGARRMTISDPATLRPLAEAPVADEPQVNEAVAAAGRAFTSWHTTTFEEREVAALSVADALERRFDELVDLVVLEQGKTRESSAADARKAILYTRYFAGLRAEPEIIREDEAARVELRHTPIGVVAAIVPWNFPLYQALYKTIPAVMAGNTVVLKPAPTTPLHAMLLGEILQPLFPPGVVNILGDDGTVGQLLTDHPGVNMVSFTGSTQVGKAVLRSSADTVKRVVAEMSGNDPAIVLPDADPDSVARPIFDSAFINSGQRCVAIKVIYAHRDIYERVLSLLAEFANAAQLGHGLSASTQLGPLQNERQFLAAQRWLESAKESGTVIAGGHLPDVTGYFVPATLVRDVALDSEFLREEVFAPIRAVVAYEDIDDLIERVNSSPFGLGASVWGSDPGWAAAVASRIDAGQVWVNHHGLGGPDVPSAGHKQSGIGVKFGARALDQLTNPQAFTIYKRSRSS